MNQTNKIRLEAEISATSKGLVDALNQASNAVNSASESWKSRFDKLKDSTSTISQGVKNLSDLMKNVGDVDPSSMSKMTEALGEVSTNFNKVKGEVDAFVQSLSQMKIEASNLGMPIEDYQRFADAVKASGVSMDEAKNMLQAMQQNIQAFANGVPEAESLFSKLGVTLEQVSSNTVGANFQLLVNTLNDTIPASERATQNMQLFKSSIDSTLQVAQQYQKTVSEQTGAYATDKDIQNAISLSSAIEKLGRQLGEYATGMNGAGNATKTASQALAEYANNGNEFAKVLDDTLKTYEKFSDSLAQKPTATGDFFSRITEEVSKLEDKFGKGELSIEEFKDKLDTFAVFMAGVDEKLKSEFDSISGIMNQRIASGAPIDTTELDNAIKGFNRLEDATDRISSIWYSFSNEMKEVLGYELESGLDVFSANLMIAGEKFENLSREVSVFNTAFDINNGNKQLEEFNKELKEAEDKLSKKLRINIDTTKVDTAIKKLREMLDEQLKEHTASDQSYGASASTVMGQVRALEFVRERFVQINAESEKQQAWWKRIGRSIGDAYRRLMGYKDGVKGATQESEKLSSTIVKGIGQMAGFGSAVAVVTTAFRKLVALGKEWLKQLLEAKEAMAYLNKAEGAEDMNRVREKASQRTEELVRKLKEYSELVAEERKTGSKETLGKRLNLQDELNKQFGMELNAANRGDVDTEIAKQLEKAQKKQIKSIEAQIKANQKVIDGVDEFIDSIEYKELLEYAAIGDINAENKIKSAQEESTKAARQNADLMEELNRLRKEDWRLEWERVKTGKQSDEIIKERKDAEDKAEKALEEASKKLDEWQNSLTDNDRQKKIREVMDRYDDLVRDGVEEAEARVVAEQAIAKILKEEADAEAKKNKELLDAMNKAIDSYKSAYKQYADANKAVVDAKKNYARTQNELADEAKKEKISKRRENLQKAMSRFGFTPYEGFSTGEKPSERRERRRNAQLDASIAEKMAKSQAGGRVHFTHAEKERIQAFEKLQKKDRALEASQKAMEAAERQKNAAQKLEDAAKAIKEAIYGRKDARAELGKAGKELREASAKRRTVAKNEHPDQIFEKARKNLYARGVAGASATKQLDYSLQFQQLHTDLQQLNKRVFVVK